ncbi:TonB-dependent receptor [Luteimonas sp. RD2P54]|uniref:TonB-dependent receptor n=1 Tax=Luteimonas endophytica TaxID=3042023 RepID=A0ABT6JDA5_9GAMM|nr:TonB-dependent receptor [Luteimonas endophytica]MDH5824751.1 TonB-dependent receptor [Luteimonas endophytica]
MKLRIPAMRRGLLPAAIVTALSPAIAAAQEQASDATTLDRIEVTGSRIRQASIETAQPVLMIGREEIEKQGFTTVADILQNLTSAGSPAISRGDVLASGENVGGYYVDLRNLGASRTLILVNGKRLGANTTGLQDLGQIPSSAIERIDVLKDGASSIYGSDAIAGVVNIITRTRFDGAEANAYFGQYDDGGGDIQTFDFTVGSTSDRGGVSLSIDYGKEEPLWARDMWYARDGSRGPDFPGAGWSPVSQNGSFFDPVSEEWLTLTPGADPTDPDSYTPLTPDQYANSNEQMMARTGIERRSIYVAGEFDLTDDIRFVSDALYNSRTTTQQVAGYPYQSGSFETPLSGDSAFNPYPGTDLEFRRRLWERPRITENELKTYRVTAGLQGAFEIGERFWDWDVGGSWNRNEMLKNGRGDASLVAARAALGPSFINEDGVAQCGTVDDPIALGTNYGADECTPWNPLQPYGANGPNGLEDPNVQAFLFPEYHDTGLTESTIYTANLSGTLFTLPAGDLGVAVGYEHRKEEGRFVPDAFNQAALSTGLPATTTAGQYSLDEMYLELNVPLLSGVAGAEELSLSLATRYSDYDTFGDTLNNKFGLTWRPTGDLLVRGTWAEGFRAPSIDNLYGGVGGSFERYVDPCGNGPGNVAGNAACTAAGVSPDYVQLGQGLDPCDSFPCQTPYQFLTGSNPNLTPEMATSKTAGIVYSPQWVEGLDLSLDWYSVEIENLIAEDSVDDILTDCYVRGVESRCAGIERDPETGVITMLNFGLTNKGRLETEGYDLGVRYRLPETAYGNFAIDWQTTYVSKHELTADNNPDTVPAPSNSFAGYFRTRSNLTLDWQMGDFGASWTARYYSGMKESCVVTDSFDENYCDQPDYAAPDVPEGLPLRTVGSNVFHDAQVRWSAPWDATVSLGANNVTDHRGPLMFTSPNNQFAYYGGFDVGRFVYMKYQQRF